MQEHTFRHRVATSAFTLPLTVVASAAVWAIPEMGEMRLWVGLGLALVVTYMLMELNNRNQLLRIRSRMVSSTFLLTLAACPWLHDVSTAYAAAIILVGIYFLLFFAYQDTQSSGLIFYAFILIATAAIIIPPFICLAPLMAFALMVQLRSLSWRTFFAAVFGTVLPLIYYAAWAMWESDFPDMLFPLFDWQPVIPTLETFSVNQLLNAGWLMFVTLLALLHYYRTNFNDKVRVRMFFCIIIEVEILLWAGLIFFPQHFDTLFLLLLVNTAPLTAHYFALARGRWPMTVWFVFNLLFLVALGLYNYGVLPQIPR